MYGVLLSRFTDETLAENRRWKQTYNKACVYGSTRAISDDLPMIEYFVIEMNITTNKIVGIGLIENKKAPKTHIYSNQYFNRYIYIGKHFIPIENVEYKEMLEELEQLIFYGKGHLKRGGLTLFPPKLLKKIYLEWFKFLLKKELMAKEELIKVSQTENT